MGIEKLKCVDSLVVIPNDNILKVVDESHYNNAFKLVDDILPVCKGSDIITKVGYVNVDFADVKAAMSNRGIVHMGRASGKTEAKKLCLGNGNLCLKQA